MSDKQVKIFYFVILLIVFFIVIFWSFFLKNKWQEKEVAVIELEPYKAAPKPQSAEIVRETVIVATPKGAVVKEIEITLPQEDVTSGNRGYTTKDGESTYRPIMTDQEDEDGVTDD